MTPGGAAGCLGNAMSRPWRREILSIYQIYITAHGDPPEREPFAASRRLMTQ
jgi:hypothetical protein